MISGAGMSSLYMYMLYIVHNRKKYILILGKNLTQGLDDITFIAEKEYAIKFSGQVKRFCLHLHYNWVNIFIFANGVEL